MHIRLFMVEDYHILPLPTAAAPKRFYKKTSVLSCDGQYEVALDNRKLKTPSGSPFVLKSEPLALAVAAEWDAQKDVIERSRMHLVMPVIHALRFHLSNYYPKTLLPSSTDRSLQHSDGQSGENHQTGYGLPHTEFPANGHNSVSEQCKSKVPHLPNVNTFHDSWHSPLIQIKLGRRRFVQISMRRMGSYDRLVQRTLRN